MRDETDERPDDETARVTQVFEALLAEGLLERVGAAPEEIAPTQH